MKASTAAIALGIALCVPVRGQNSSSSSSHFETGDSTGLVSANLADTRPKEPYVSSLNFFYAGYMSGVLDATPSVRECLPDGGVTHEEIQKIVGKYMENHPEKEHLPVKTNVIAALHAAYCGTNP